MRKQVILTIILCLSTFVVAYPQQFDKASAEFFWKVVDKLKQDKPLTDSLWKEFRSKYAHRNWLERHNKGWSERYESGYRKALAIVFRPSLAAQRDSILRIPEPKEFLPKDDSWSFTNMHVREIYNSYFKDEDKIRSFYANKLDSNYLDTIYRIATTMLPTGFEKPTKKLDTLTIYIHGISNAASAGSYGIMFSMSLLYSREKNNLGNLGSHELHHILRESFIKNSIAQEDLYAVTAMEQTLNEGSADLLSTDYEGFDDWVDYNTTDSDSILTVLDTWFQSKNSYTEEDVNVLFKYSGGHNPGHYMAEIINRNGFRSELRENVDNPFYFFLLYQKAALVDAERPPVFSQESINYIKRLEGLYLKK